MFFGLLLKKPGRQAPFVCVFSLDCASLEYSAFFFSFFLMMPVFLSIIFWVWVLIAAVAYVVVEMCG